MTQGEVEQANQRFKRQMHAQQQLADLVRGEAQKLTLVGRFRSLSVGTRLTILGVSLLALILSVRHASAPLTPVEVPPVTLTLTDLRVTRNAAANSGLPNLEGTFENRSPRSARVVLFEVELRDPDGQARFGLMKAEGLKAGEKRTIATLVIAHADATVVKVTPFSVEWEG